MTDNSYYDIIMYSSRLRSAIKQLMYYFYILRCSDNSLYCGMTTNLKKRLKEHNSKGARGAKYLRARKPVKIVYSEEYADIKSAMGREYEVKQWTKAKKEELVCGLS